MKKWTLLSAIILASACSVKTIPVPVVLDLPPEIDWPKIEASELECLSDDAYSRLVTRDKLKSERIETLKSIIRSTRGDE